MFSSFAKLVEKYTQYCIDNNIPLPKDNEPLIIPKELVPVEQTKPPIMWVNYLDVKYIDKKSQDFKDKSG